MDTGFVIASELRDSLHQRGIDNPDKLVADLLKDGLAVLEGQDYGQADMGEVFSVIPPNNSFAYASIFPDPPQQHQSMATTRGFHSPQNLEKLLPLVGQKGLFDELQRFKRSCLAESSSEKLTSNT